MTHERLLELLYYDPDSGLFTWRVTTSNRVKVGAAAGYVDPAGYTAIRLDSKLYLAHRLAWFYVYGKWPEKGIDHKDGNPANNRIDNLRVADQTENNQNRRLGSRNKSGYAGVSWNTNVGKWLARVTVRGEIYHLGYFKELEDAVAARIEGKKKHHTFNPEDRYLKYG